MNTNKVIVWAGSDLYSIINPQRNTSVKSILNRMMPDLEDVFGFGVSIKRLSDTKYIVDVDGVKV